ncbi:hypothetical protein QTI24_30460 [Variovorax sp. J22P240]|uniref:hypothetical protein n=1 Tax=Variovorax sp. J22P240 TaxID=3053514 RepID=UPI00257523EF|nr:hypothetical protein [Variovorax sp. J22P240]MDM0002945.1 hypothetical protein [Variovorax sp. J22P240]
MKPRLRTSSSLALPRCRWGVLGAGLLGAAVAFASSLADTSAPAEPYSLKGFTPGQAMVGCPVQWQKYRNDAGFSCIQHGGKLASRPIQATFLRIENGKLVSVWIDMKDPGDWVHVQSALTQKYGAPAFERGASRAWVSPDAQLSVGNSGGVLLLGAWKAQQGATAAVDL